MVITSTNITRVTSQVAAERRWQRQGHRGGVLWFTGLPRAGKSTLVYGLESILFQKGWLVRAFESRDFRAGLSEDLGYTRTDRREHIRRVGEVAALFARRGVVVLTSFISPFAEDRANARAATGDGFREVYLNASLDVCEKRDDRGIYARARAGEIEEFTGISAPYEPPVAPDLIVPTGERGETECLNLLRDYALDAFGLESE